MADILSAYLFLCILFIVSFRQQQCNGIDETRRESSKLIEALCRLHKMNAIKALTKYLLSNLWPLEGGQCIN